MKADDIKYTPHRRRIVATVARYLPTCLALTIMQFACESTGCSATCGIYTREHDVFQDAIGRWNIFHTAECPVAPGACMLCQTQAPNHYMTCMYYESGVTCTTPQSCYAWQNESGRHRCPGSGDRRLGAS